MPAGILGFVLPPALSKLYDEDRMDEVKMHLSYSLKYSLTLAIPFVFGAAIQVQFYALAVVAIVNSVIAAFYYLNVLRYMFFQPAFEGAPTLKLSPALTVTLAVTCALTLVIGLYAQPFLQLAQFSVGLLGI